MQPGPRRPPFSSKQSSQKSLFLLIAAAYLIDGALHPRHRGLIFSPYIAYTQNRKFMKYKFRIHEETAIDKEARKKGDFMAYPSESSASTLTCLGIFLKRHYLNELPQIFNILKGDISFVGIRPVAKEHYFSDVKQGHVRRAVLKAGIFSQTHVRKGTPDRYNNELDYDYIRKYMTLSAPALLWLDVKIVFKGIVMIIKGETKR